jgi:ABC-type nitrate/sulfonate/bicarbonate transport system permease component
MTDAALPTMSLRQGDLARAAVGRRRRRTYSKIVLGFAFPLTLILLWEGLVRIGVIDGRFFPAPSQTARSFGTLLADPDERGRLVIDIVATYQRLLMGYALGATLGIATGMAMALSRPIRFSLAPFINVTFPTPKLAIFPLLIVAFGLGDGSKVALIAMGVFYMTCLSTLSGVLYSNPIHHDVAQAFRMPASTRWFRVVIPSALPSIINGMKLGLGQALILVVSSEFVSAQTGLGHFIWDSWQVLDVSRMFLGLIVVALTGGGAVLLGNLAEHYLIPWAKT